jgi:Leucine-rich repeat (LRR) protein
MREGELVEIIELAATEGWTELDISSNKLTALPPELVVTSNSSCTLEFVREN